MIVRNTLMISTLTKYTRLIKKSLINKEGNVEYWERRARQYGRRSVLNTGHSDTEFDSVTQLQKQVIFPYLQQALRGNEKLILDFGCGPGRFTGDLADMIGGQVIGVDPVRYLLDMAPQHKAVQYKLMQEGEIPLPDNSVDIVWICLVLGGISDGIILNKTIAEIKRVLAIGGLLFLIENTSQKQDIEHWKFRSVQDYRQLFDLLNLTHVFDYFDLGERISIMTGNK